MTDKLKPCPFCGSDDLGSGGDDKVVGYWCKNCQATGPNHYGKHEWNTRADAEALKAADGVAEKLDRDWSNSTIDDWKALKLALAAYNEKRGERK